MTEESFEVRVKRLFGSKLFDSVPESSFPLTSWFVADGEVERQEWNRERGAAPAGREDAPVSSAFYDEGGCFAKKPDRTREVRKELEDDLEELDDGDEEGEAAGGGVREDGDEGGSDGEREEREIRSSVGLDPTLEYEEEDEYDIVALCREYADERMYMRDIKDRVPYMNCHTMVPDLFDDSFVEVYQFRRDSRADHFAASVRLKEDKEAAEYCPNLPTRINGEPFVASRVKSAEDDVNLKPILKRKGQEDSRPKKRVRFNTGCKDGHDEPFEEPQDFHRVPQSMETNAGVEGDSSLPEGSPGVPDYLRNPSKYTHYTFDMSEEDDREMNKHAIKDFRNLVKRSNPDELQCDFPMELPKTVTFTPRRKSSDAMRMDDSSEFVHQDSSKESGQMLACSAGTVAEETHDSEACEMEEDGVETPAVEASASTWKDRRYRSKSTPDYST